MCKCNLMCTIGLVICLHYSFRVIGRERRRSQSNKRKEKVHRDVLRRDKDYRNTCLFDLGFLIAISVSINELYLQFIHTDTDRYIDTIQMYIKYIYITLSLMKVYIYTHCQYFQHCTNTTNEVFERYNYVSNDNINCCCLQT